MASGSRGQQRRPRSTVFLVLAVLLAFLMPSGHGLLRKKPPQVGARGPAGQNSKMQEDLLAPDALAAPIPPMTKAARSLVIATVTGGALMATRENVVKAWVEDLTPVAKYLPLARHQLLILAAWALNQAAVRVPFWRMAVPGRLDGKSWKASTAVRFFTPSGWAFAIWAPIFLGEMLFAFYQLSSAYTSPRFAPYIARLSPHLACAFFTQALWCVAFRPWAAKMQYLSASLLGATAIGLHNVHKVLRQAARDNALSPVDYAVAHLPLSLHFGWITCATLVNLNGWFASTSLRTGDKLGLALGSVNLAVTLGSQVTLTSGDPIYSLVVAWALYAIADDLKPNKSYLRKDKVVGDDALDCLETTAAVSANLQVGVSAMVVVWKVLVALKLVEAGDWKFWAKRAGDRLAKL